MTAGRGLRASRSHRRQGTAAARSEPWLDRDRAACCVPPDRCGSHGEEWRICHRCNGHPKSVPALFQHPDLRCSATGCVSLDVLDWALLCAHRVKNPVLG
ncbi:hypothetical protein AV530_017855 [Patagioenas fasciata monilis]|uniref:Uncharacterized protein n=1 Tax=Patagioenas fasciata monilis TaxID=372326 RepID=A0A1V4KA03_PATFA|nr:hypothetical protein AV530_017855 [Patagioenas fasciata monilis]